MIKYLILIGLIVVTLPFWLPTSMGGDTAYPFMPTESMKGTLDPGAFIILRRSDSYAVGDVMGYRQIVGQEKGVTILHRVVGRLPDGRYVMKGDAVPTKERITGRMVAAIPGLGFVPGAFRSSPILFGAFLVSGVFLVGLVGAKKSSVDKLLSGSRTLFLPAAFLLLLTFPFATEGVVNIMGRVPLYLLLISLLCGTRVGEIRWTGGSQGSALYSTVVDINYVVVIFLSVTVIRIPKIVDSLRTVLSF